METILTAIANGEADDRFEEVYAAIKARKKVVASIRAASTKVGDKVRLANLRPKYLAGMTGTVQRIQGNGNFVVALDSEYINEAFRYIDDGGCLVVRPGMYETL